MSSAFARLAITSAAVAGLVVGCAPAPPASTVTPESTVWDPQAFLKEESRRGAELLGISDPPAVEVIRFVRPLEQDEVLLTCLGEAGYDFELAPGGGLLFPKEQPDELKASMDMAIYTCWEQYPIDPKFRAPDTEDRLKWMYLYTSTTLLECLRANGTPYTGEVPSEQVYLDSKGDWSPFSSMNAHYDMAAVDSICPQTPPEYYEQSFW